MPEQFYIRAEILKADLDAVFGADGCSPATGRNPRSGDYLTLEIGTNSVSLRDRDGRVQAFHNTCRHRGSRICMHETGHAHRLVCPYHQWVYELDGRLINARQMPKEFDTSGMGLKPARSK